MTSTSGAAVTKFSLHGTYVQPAMKISEIKPLPGGKKASFRADSGTAWHGDLEGDTKFVMHGVADYKTYSGPGTVDEVFTGSVAGVGAGHLHFAETYTDTNGNVSVDCTIVSGDGALAALRGTMHFAGSGVPATGAGRGTYVATFTRPSTNT